MVRGQVNRYTEFDASERQPSISRKSRTSRKPLPSRRIREEQIAKRPAWLQSGSVSPVQEPVDKSNSDKTASSQRKLIRYLQKNWQLSFVWIGALGLFGGMGLSAYLWLAGLPPLPNCKTTTPLSPDAHRLYCARETARSGTQEDLVTGIALVKNWSPNHPLYQDAQQSLTKWSKRLILVARDKMNQNDFKGAIDAINQIPQSSPVYEEAQKTAAAWKEQWQAGESYYQKALAAIEQQNWHEAFDQVTEMGYLEHDYWRLQQADDLARKISVQKEASDALNHAKKLAKNAVPEQLGEAIELLQNVAPETFAWQEAQQLTIDWSQNLLKTALQYWREGNSSMAIELAQQVPLNLQLPAAEQDLVKFSHAHKLVEDSQIEGKLAWRHLWSLLEATTALSQIQSSSPVYEQAQAKLQDWQAQFQDLQKLQFANVIADLGHKPALEYAISQANQITPDRQRYRQAQTMSATWQQQIEWLEDVPYLRLAQQFAATNIIADLQLAIAQAQVIPPQRALWGEVQTQIKAWQQQIQKTEDQPILDKAETLAKANKLDEAIATAAEISPNRALYEQAQAAINSWKAKIQAAQMAEDRSLLDRAMANAGASRLTEAIATAAQIAPGRPLYLEAQAAIGAWLRERDGIKPDATNPSESPADISNSEVEPSSPTEAAEETLADPDAAEPIAESEPFEEFSDTSSTQTDLPEEAAPETAQ